MLTSAKWRSKTRREDDCLIWTGRIGNRGYGLYGGRVAHRQVYEIERGPIPAGLVLDHLCRQKACVNPDHLEPVTQAENLRRGPTVITTISAAKTHCHRGHEFAAENTLIELNRGRYMQRTCRQCKRDRRKGVAA